MQPLNQAERNSAFLSFLFLFLVTIVLIVTVIFFSIEVPYKESRSLRQQMFDLQKQKDVTDSFNVIMREAVAELSNFEAKKESPAATYQRVQVKIELMNGLLKDIPNSINTVYGLSVQNLDDLNKAKSRLSSIRSE